MSILSELQNIGKEIEQKLLQVDIDTPEKLKEIGSKQAWLKIKSIDPSTCYNCLCALEGAIQDIRWHHLEEGVKQELKEFYNSFKI